MPVTAFPSPDLKPKTCNHGIEVTGRVSSKKWGRQKGVLTLIIKRTIVSIAKNLIPLALVS